MTSCCDARGARVLEGDAASRRCGAHGDTWIVNETIEAPVVIGAGGHFCPVARHMRGGADTARPVVAKEAEFLLEADDAGATPTDSRAVLLPRPRRLWLVRAEGRLPQRRHRPARRPRIRDARQGLRRVPRSAADAHAAPPTSRWHGHAYFASGAGPRPVDRRRACCSSETPPGSRIRKAARASGRRFESGRLAAADADRRARPLRASTTCSPMRKPFVPPAPAMSTTPAPARAARRRSVDSCSVRRRLRVTSCWIAGSCARKEQSPDAEALYG